MKIHDFKKFKSEGRKISMVTCYDFWSAQIISQSNMDCILVGDSTAMVMHGHSSTLTATVDMMATHVLAVAKGAPNKFIIGDLPFLSYRKDLTQNMLAIEKLMQAGSQALKLEGAKGNLEFIEHVVASGVPVMGHLGLTPQSLHQLGGFRVQGRNPAEFESIVQDAVSLQEAGCFGLVLECVPQALALKISQLLEIPVIGIGASNVTDGQVLVLHDMLGMNKQFHAKFLRKYLDGHKLILDALNEYDNDVKTLTFPLENESYL